VRHSFVNNVAVGDGAWHRVTISPASMDGVMADAAAPAEAAPLQWRYVTIIYSCGCGICAIFAVLDRVIEIEQVKGFWLIFALFPFCLVYSIYRQRLQASENSKAKIE